jgi:hypothetical protein
MVTAGVIYTLKLQEERVQQKPTRIIPRATPAQEPLTLQETRAAERGRGRTGPRPAANSLARLEGYFCPHLL